MIEEQYRTSKVEALILASPEPLPTRRITKVMDNMTPGQVAKAIAQLNNGYADTGSSFRIRELAGGYQFYILPEYEGVLESLYAKQRKVRLSRAALETVAIVAYRQPATKTEIEHIRGVASDGVLRTLLERGLIAITGRADTVGKPLQYGTTDEFLKFFGLARLDDLPQMSEIEQMISSEEARHQTELEFGIDAAGRLMKLNIADGTFDPEKRELLEDGIPLEAVEEARPDDGQPPTDMEPAADETEEAPATLVMKKGEEVAEAPAEETPEIEEAEAAETPVTSRAGD
jgi:segregation and condensation protein B